MLNLVLPGGLPDGPVYPVVFFRPATGPSKPRGLRPQTSLSPEDSGPSSGYTSGQ